MIWKLHSFFSLMQEVVVKKINPTIKNMNLNFPAKCCSCLNCKRAYCWINTYMYKLGHLYLKKNKMPYFNLKSSHHFIINKSFKNLKFNKKNIFSLQGWLKVPAFTTIVKRLPNMMMAWKASTHTTAFRPPCSRIEIML